MILLPKTLAEQAIKKIRWLPDLLDLWMGDLGAWARAWALLVW